MFSTKKNHRHNYVIGRLTANEPLNGKPTIRVSDQVRHKAPCTVTEVARGLQFWIYVEHLYYPSSENKGTGTDQLPLASPTDCWLISRDLWCSGSIINHR